MKCCKPFESNITDEARQGEQHRCGSGLKHMIMMIACCLAPIGGVLLLKLSGYEGAASYLMFLLCPLMHLFMMKGMAHKKQENATESNAVK